MADSRTPSDAVKTASAAVEDVAWRAVIDATQSTFEVLAELGRDADGAVAFVARPLVAGDLVILKLEPDALFAGAARRYSLFVLKQLDDTVPAPRIGCAVCAAVVAIWRGRCPACGSPIGAGADGPLASEVLLAFYQFVSSNYDVVGEFATEGAGPPAYFVKAHDASRYAMLRLALGGTAAMGPNPYVIDVLPLVGPGAGTPAPPARVPLDVGTPPAEVAPTPTNAERVCPQCGARFGGGTLFCPRDGASLRKVESGADLVGQLIDDRYYVEQRLGEGGMGEVYIAHQVRTGRKCALKLMHRAMTNDPDAVGRFRREASSACAISHPNVATIFDSGETHDHRPYFAMEFVDGRSLSQVIREERSLDPWRAADIARQIAEGLSAAHDLDIVHRDLKPDNVMLGAARGGADYVKLVDFGIAKPTTGSGNTLTRPGFILGTPAYMSPEQLCGDKLDGRTDLYSLGCVLHEMLTGETPFAGGESLDVVMMRRLTEAAPRPSALNDQVPALLDEIVARLLARAPDERYPDARAVAEALGAAQDAMEGPRPTTAMRKRGGPVAARTPTPGPSAPASVQVIVGTRPPRRSREAVPPAPLSPALPFRSLSLGEATPTAEAPRPAVPVGVGVPSRAPTRLAVTALGVALLGGGLFVSWRLTRQTSAAASAPPRSATAPAPQPDTRGAPVAVNEHAATAATRRLETSPAPRPVTRQPTATTPARPVPDVTKPVLSSPQTGSQASTTPVTPPPESKAVERAPPPAVSEAKPRVDSAAEAERAETPRIRQALESYVRAIGAKQMDVLLELFPGMNDRARGGYKAMFESASDLSAQPTGAPTIAVHGSTADAEFAYDIKGYMSSRGNFTQHLSSRAKLQRTGPRWIIVDLLNTAQ